LVESGDDGSCTFTERSNSNFSTVSSYGNKAAGIVFTPKTAGQYYICANVGVASTSDSSYTVELSDSTGYIIALIGGDIQKTSYAFQQMICGIYPVTTISQKSIRIRVADSGSNLTINRAYGNTIEWTIINITQNFPMPVILNNVSTSASSGVKIVSAAIQNTGTPTIESQDGTWISSLDDLGTGNVRINFTTGTFSAAPRCTGIAGSPRHVALTEIASLTHIEVIVNTDAGAASDAYFEIICVGAK
jgi:hypothetical protein